MTENEIKKLLIRATDQFKTEYPEWADYDIRLTPENNTIKVETENEASTVKEALRDFATVLKKSNLMLEKFKNLTPVVEYSYLVEDGLDDLADELELKLGGYFSNLVVREQKGKPYVRFNYIGSLTSDEKANVLNQVKSIVAQYQPVDEDDVFADIEFDDFDSVMDEIENDDSEEHLELDDEVKAEDSNNTVIGEFLTKHNLTEADYRNLLRYEQVRQSGKYNMFEYMSLMKKNNMNGGEKLVKFIIDKNNYSDFLKTLNTKAEDNREIFNIVVEGDAPVEYTRAEVEQMLEPEQIKKLLNGESIMVFDAEDGEFEIYLVL